MYCTNIVSWFAMIARYIKNEFSKKYKVQIYIQNAKNKIHRMLKIQGHGLEEYMLILHLVSPHINSSPLISTHLDFYHLISL